MTDIEILRAEKMKKDDTYPPLRVKLLDDGNPFNLTDYTVNMRMKKSDGDSLTVDDSATVDVANRGIVTYDWSGSDTDEVGVYQLEFVADDGSGSIATFPNNGYATIIIEEGLN